MFAFLYLYADIHSVTLSRWIGARAKYTFFFAILFIPHVVTTHLTSSNVVCLFPPPHHYACAFTASIWMSLIYIHMRTNRKKKKARNKIEWSLTSFRCRGFNYQTSNRVFLYTQNFSIILRVSLCQCIVRSLALCPQYSVLYGLLFVCRSSCLSRCPASRVTVSARRDGVSTSACTKL